MVISLWCKQNVSINYSVHSHSCQSVSSFLTAHQHKSQVAVMQSFTPYVSITVSCSLSLSHQCHTRQTPLHLQGHLWRHNSTQLNSTSCWVELHRYKRALRKMSAETRASDIFDLNGAVAQSWTLSRQDNEQRYFVSTKLRCESCDTRCLALFVAKHNVQCLNKIGWRNSLT